MRFVKISDKSGWYCGYVGVKDNSMLPHSVQGDINMLDNYENSLDNKISVHGGITFDGTWDENTDIIPLTDIPEDWYKYHYYGFDLNHCNDKLITKDFNYAKQEVLNMKKQIEELIAQLSTLRGIKQSGVGEAGAYAAFTTITANKTIVKH